MSNGPAVPLSEVVTDDEPSDKAKILHWFISQGISWQDIREMPLPVIFSVLETENWVQEQKEKERKKHS